MFVDFTLWTYLLAASIGIFGTLWALVSPNKEKLKKALMLGLFLAVFDFIFENMGATAGLWYSFGSPLFLLNVPIQVFFIALLAGAAYHLVIQPRKDALYSLSTAFLIAVAGTGIESILLDFKLLAYTGGWTSTHALAAYFATFMLLHFVNLKIHGKRVFHEQEHEKTHSKSSMKTKKRRR